MNDAGGKVYLVGAGPGHPELLTLKALRVLREADVVLHDDLVSREILGLIPRTVTIESVGKRCGAARVTQEEINATMVAYAQTGRTVVRLKSGDPMLFGRAGEEIDVLRSANIAFEVVPGISTAFAAAAVLETSLTDRRKSSRVVFTTGHQATQTHSDRSTHVVYMPGEEYSNIVRQLVAEGVSPDAPCAVISAASMEGQSTLRTTIADLPKLAPLPAPSILIVGEVIGESAVSIMSQISAGSIRERVSVEPDHLS